MYVGLFSWLQALHNIPTIIQEQNVIAGITNKILSRFVDVVALGYKDAEASFSKAKRVVYTGNPCSSRCAS